MTAESWDTQQLLSALKALQEGDFSARMPEAQAGEAGEVAREYNRHLDQMQTFASEMKRIFREVGTEARFGGQAEVEGLSGEWKGLVESANLMSANLTNQLRNMTHVVTSIANGDFTRLVEVEVEGELAELKEAINRMVHQFNRFAYELTRVSREIGTEGKFGPQMDVPGLEGTWKDLMTNVNVMAASLTSQVRDLSYVAHNLTCGDLNRRATVPAELEMSELKESLNRIVDLLGAFASQVSRVSSEIGHEGKPGDPIRLEQASGVWKKLVEDINAVSQGIKPADAG